MSSFSEYVEYRGGKLYWIKRPTNRVKVGDEVGTLTPNGYRVTALKGVKYMVHRMIWELHHGAIPEGLEVDHKDNNRDNNLIDNLRLATRGQNSQNHSKQSRNRFGVKGMNTRKRGNCLQYIGIIRANGKQYRISSTDRAEVEAWLANKREALHGQFANHG